MTDKIERKYSDICVKYNKIIGINIRKYRNLRGVSQEALAKELGVTFQQIQKYELAKNRISAGALLNVARILRVPVLWMYCRDKNIKLSRKEEISEICINEKPVFTASEIELIQFIRKADNPIRDGIFSIIKGSKVKT